MPTRRALLLSTMATLLAAAGCVSDDAARTSAPAETTPAVVVINDTCPVAGAPVSDAIEPVVHDGHAVGFCCDGCRSRWVAMPDADKDAAVAAMLAGDEASAGPVNRMCPVMGMAVRSSVETVTYRGHKIGFCCDGCAAMFASQSDMEKDAYLAALLADEAVPE